MDRAGSPRLLRSTAAPEPRVTINGSLMRSVREKVEDKTGTQQRQPSVPIQSAPMNEMGSPSRRRKATANHAARTENRFPERPPIDLKTRLIFEEFDVNNSRSLDRDGFKSVLTVLNFVFSDQTIDEIFKQIDMRNTGTVLYPQFRDFTERFPTFVEAIYDRCRAAVERSRMESLIEASKADITDFYTNERAAHAAWQDAVAKLNNREGPEMQVVTETVQATKTVERGQRSELIELEKSLEAARNEENYLLKKVRMAETHEEDIMKPLSETRKALQKCNAKIKSYESDIETANEKEKALMEMLREVRQERTKLRDQIIEEESKHDSLVKQEAQQRRAHEEASGITRKKKELLKSQTAEVNFIQEEVNNFRSTVDAAKQDAKKSEKNLDEAKDSASAARQMVLDLKLAHMAASKRLENVQRELHEKEQDLEKFETQRRQQEASEAKLVNDEIRLKFHRDEMKEREAALNSMRISIGNTKQYNSLLSSTRL